MSDNKKWKLHSNFAESTVSTTFLTMSAYRQRRQFQTSPISLMSSSIPSSVNITSSKVQETPFKKNSNLGKQLFVSNFKQHSNNFASSQQKSLIHGEKVIDATKRAENRREGYERSQMEEGIKYVNSKQGVNNCNLEKIMQKINKKQQLINQLRELSKISVSDMIKQNPHKTNKANHNQREYYSESNKDKQGSEATKVKISFRRSVADYKQSSPTQLYNTLQLKIQKYDKNPENESSDFNKAKNGYYTHREIQSKITQHPPILGYSSVQNSIVIPKKKVERASVSYTLANQSIIESPLLTPRGQDAKNIQQMRLRRTKNNSIYFAAKITSIYQFQILKTLGQGKFGKVFQAIHKATNSIFAIKKIQKKVIKENMMIDQLIKEIKIQSFCKHQNILQLHGVFDDREYIYLVLEYMEQGTLFSELKRRKILTEKQASMKLKYLAKAIVYLHDNGIAHRDIKPQNIVLSNGVAKLCDFGWATLCIGGRRMTYCGTFDYTAPQILQGIEYDMSVDLWCLGILAYELMVGKAPFYHISRKQTMKRIMNVENQSIQYPANLSKDAVSFIEGLIKKKPEQRMNGMNILCHPFILKAQQQ